MESGMSTPNGVPCSRVLDFVNLTIIIAQLVCLVRSKHG